MTTNSNETSPLSTPQAGGYFPIGDEVEVFETAYKRQLAVMLKGPTGCGKTKLVEHIANTFAVPLYTVSCHEDITVADLVGKFELQNGATHWVDGPLTRAAKEGGICYLDEVVEARQDATVAIHSLTDHRRELFIERLGWKKIEAAAGFCLVVSFNPGYQSILKNLKMSTRQRMVSIEMDYPTPAVESQIIAQEAGVSAALADKVVRVGQALRGLKGTVLRESPSTRLLINTAIMIDEGLNPVTAAMATLIGPLTDDETLSEELRPIIDTYLG